MVVFHCQSNTSFGRFPDIHYRPLRQDDIAAVSHQVDDLCVWKDATDNVDVGRVEGGLVAPARLALRIRVAAEDGIHEVPIVADRSGKNRVGIGDQLDRKSTRLNSSHYCASRMPSSA